MYPCNITSLFSFADPRVKSYSLQSNSVDWNIPFHCQAAMDIRFQKEQQQQEEEEEEGGSPPSRTPSLRVREREKKQQ